MYCHLEIVPYIEDIIHTISENSAGKFPGLLAGYHSISEACLSVRTSLFFRQLDVARDEHFRLRRMLPVTP